MACLFLNINRGVVDDSGGRGELWGGTGKRVRGTALEK